MLKKLISGFVKPADSEQNPAEAAIAETISTPEKLAELVDGYERDLRLLHNTMNQGSPRGRALKNKLSQLKIARARFDMAAEKPRIAEALARNTEAAKTAIVDADARLSAAQKTLAAQTEKLANLDGRLEPLRADLASRKVQAEENVKTAQAAFNAALMEGDDDKEIAAAESLVTAKSIFAARTNNEGPHTLRVQSLEGERALAVEAAQQATLQLKEAVQNQLRAVASLKLIEYDRLLMPLMDAWAAAKVAADKCGYGAYPPHSVGEFSILTSNSEHMPSASAAEALLEIDLAMLAQPLPDAPPIVVHDVY